MNWDEKIAFDWLIRQYDGSILFEPLGNVPPDFVCGGQAFEVTRLEHTAQINGKLKPLNFATSTSKLFHDLVEKYRDISYTGLTYDLQVKGSYNEKLGSTNIKQIKRWIEDAVCSIRQGVPFEPIRVFGGLSICISKTERHEQNPLSTSGLYSGLISIDDCLFMNGVHYAISKKEKSCKKLFTQYHSVSLILVNHQSQYLRPHHIPPAVRIASKSKFDKVIVIHPSTWHQPIYLAQQ